MTAHEANPYIVALRTADGGFVPFSYHPTSKAAWNRIDTLAKTPHHREMNVYLRMHYGVYKRIEREETV